MKDSVRKLALKAVSSRLQSRVVGMVSDVHMGAALPVLIKAWTSRFGVRMDEAEVPSGGFDSFNSFFTRRLKPGMRPVDPDPDAMICPCDGAVQTAGPITSGMLFQAKGFDYRLADLLGDSTSAAMSADDAARFEGGYYLTIYLSPGDYHRVHFPVSGRVRRIRHIQGGLLSVAPRVLELFDEVFCRNERVAGLIESDNGHVGMVMVGATSVGRISLSFSDVVSNVGRAHGTSVFTDPIVCARGDEYGVFNLGSTVVVLVEKGRWTPVHPAVGSKVRLGQAIFRKI